MHCIRVPRVSKVSWRVSWLFCCICLHFCTLHVEFSSLECLIYNIGRTEFWFALYCEIRRQIAFITQPRRQYGASTAYYGTFYFCFPATWVFLFLKNLIQPLISSKHSRLPLKHMIFDWFLEIFDCYLELAQPTERIAFRNCSATNALMKTLRVVPKKCIRAPILVRYLVETVSKTCNLEEFWD